MKRITHAKWIWHNGKSIPWEDATLHVMSHVVHYGSAVFEGIRCYDTPDGPSLFRLGDHLRRLIESCRIYRIGLGYDESQLARACRELLAANDLSEAYIRPLVFRGEGALGVHPEGSSVEAYVVCWPWGAYLGEDALEQGVDVCVSSWSRPAPNTHPTMAKLGGNYLNAQLIKMEATANGYAEGIGLGTDGLVSEASGQNLFLVKNGTLFTPSLDGSILSGLTRDCVMVLAREMDIPTCVQRIPREMLYIADEMFLTGTASEITPVRSVDKVPLGCRGAGPITRRLQEGFLNLARGREPDKYGWRTPVHPSRKVHVA